MRGLANNLWFRKKLFRISGQKKNTWSFGLHDGVELWFQGWEGEESQEKFYKKWYEETEGASRNHGPKHRMSREQTLAVKTQRSETAGFVNVQASAICRGTSESLRLQLLDILILQMDHWHGIVNETGKFFGGRGDR